MQLAVAPIGEPQAGLIEHQKLVEERVARRMAVQRLMLERAVQADEIGADRQRTHQGSAWKNQVRIASAA